MKSQQHVRGNAYAVLDSVHAEYRTLTQHRRTFSLLELLSDPSFRLDTYCKEFTAHPYAATLKKTAREFCDKYGIWLPGSDAYITCAMYLFPNTPLYRIIPIIRNNAIDFYLNDVMGREVFHHLPQDQQIISTGIKERMAGLSRDLSIGKNAYPVEIANYRTLNEISYISPAGWFNEFLDLYCYHIQLAHQDCNSAAMDYLPTVDEYTWLRSHISGMPHTVRLIEFSSGMFIHHDELVKAGIEQPFERINWVVSLIGCLLNDLFSFEKEVIDNHSDSNLVAIHMLNDPRLSLEDALRVSCMQVRDLLLEFIHLVDQLRQETIDDQIDDISFREKIDTYLAGLERCVQACWTWQVYTRRYKRAVSVWRETTLTEDLTKVTPI